MEIYTVDQQFSQPIGQCISEITEKKLLSEITAPQAQPASVCLNSSILTVE